MSMRGVIVLCLLACGSAAAAPAEQPAAVAPPAALDRNIYTVAYPQDQKTPFLVPCSAEESVLIVVPFRITGWAGRGFVPQGQGPAGGGADSAAAIAGDFEIIPGLLNGYKQFAISALVNHSDRTLHIMMEGDRVLTLEFYIVPGEEQAFRRVKFVDAVAAATAVDGLVQNEHSRAATIKRSDEAPESRYTEPTPASQEGLRTFARALLAMTESRAKEMIAANPAIQAERLSKSEPFGDFTILQRYAIRDDVTDTLAVVVALRNDTKMQLSFDPRSWIIRAGDRVYPVPTTDFAGALEPDKTALVVLELARDQAGMPTRLLPSSPLRISVQEAGKASTKPVMVDPL